MRPLKLTLAFARHLKILIEGGEINYGDFSGGGKKLLQQFIDDSVLTYVFRGTQQRKVVCSDSPNLVNYLHNKFEIPLIDVYIDFLEKEEVERSDAVKAASNSKIRKTSVLAGFLVNCYNNLPCSLEGDEYMVTPRKGVFPFITSTQSFLIPVDVTVVVVEGHENFREIERQSYLFSGMNPLFVWRYQNSNAVAEWLNRIPNPFIHFGDYDPKGIHIYLSEFKSKIIRPGKFFIPENIHELLPRHGEKRLFERQRDFLPLIVGTDDPELVHLIELIKKHRKGLAQEILIR